MELLKSWCDVTGGGSGDDTGFGVVDHSKLMEGFKGGQRTGSRTTVTTTVTVGAPGHVIHVGGAQDDTQASSPGVNFEELLIVCGIWTGFTDV